MSRTPVELEKAGGRDAPRPVTGVAGARTPKSILVVDDNEDILFFMRAALEQAGYEVQTASEGAQALEQQMQHRADLLITDIFMPGQDGIETLRDTKTRFPQTRVIVMSAGGGSGGKLDYLSTAALIGANATLRKPFGLNELLDTVHKVLKP
jgi:DNA-binding NtrC family response regulator